MTDDNSRERKSDVATTESSTTSGVAETKAVFWLKIALLCIFIIAAIAVALFVYFYTQHAETSEFEARFDDEATKMLDSVKGTFYNSLVALDAYVVDLVSFAEYSNSEWPFVTMPNHAVRGAKLCSLSKAFYFGQYHLVSDAQREQWEAFSLSNSSTWVDDGLRVQKGDPNYHGVHVSDYEPFGQIYTGNLEVVERSPIYLPTWNSYPVVPIFPPFNWDANTHPPVIDSFRDLFENRKVTVRVTSLPHENEEDYDSVADWANDYVNDTNAVKEPIIEIYFPISTGSLDSVTQSSNNSSGSVVGILTAAMFFFELLQDILPNGTGGIVAVFEIGDHTFTYAVNGKNAIYEGPGDWHNSRYDHMEQRFHFLDDRFSSQGNQLYTGLPMTDKVKQATMSIYPSETMEQNFATNHSITYTVVAVLTFAFTAMLFIVYDLLRTRALNKATQTAVKSTANAALLDDMVKKRTRELESANTKLEEANREVVRTSEARLRHFASMSHEIRTPLNCVIGMSSLLRNSNLPPMQAEAMQLIATSGELLLMIVNDVLDYSKMESGNADIVICRSSLADALSSAVHSMNVKGASNDVTVRTIYDPNVPEFIDTDLRRLSQVLYNLLGNAMKFSNTGNLVFLSVSICDVDSPSIGAANASGPYKYSPPRVYKGKPLPELQGRVLRFSVKDVGRGVKEQDFPKIFQPFLQADRAESLYGGTGLGLAITATLVHGLGGRISVSSVEEQWSEFTFDLPFAETIETNNVAQTLQDARVLFVGCSDFEQQRMDYIFRSLHVEFNFPDLESLHSALYADTDGTLTTTKTCICVVNEDIFDEVSFRALSNLGQPIILTFGPNFTWADDAHQHFRSLTEVLPSVLLGHMIRCIHRPESNQAPLHRISGSRDRVSFESLRVLVAEDNLVNQKVLSRLLSRLGIKNCTVVDNGAKAVEREKNEPYDVILMDMEMPVMDGTEATKRICFRSEEGSHPRAPVIFISAHVADHFEEQCRNAGAIDFLSKPCTIESLEKCLQNLVLGKYIAT